VEPPREPNREPIAANFSELAWLPQESESCSTSDYSTFVILRGWVGVPSHRRDHWFDPSIAHPKNRRSDQVSDSSDRTPGLLSDYLRDDDSKIWCIIVAPRWSTGGSVLGGGRAGVDSGFETTSAWMSPIMSSAEHGAPGGAEQGQDRSEHCQDDPDSQQDRAMDQKPHDEQDDAKSDHDLYVTTYIRADLRS
jgi:hypothetical protein